MGTQEDYPTLTYRNEVDVSDIFGLLEYAPSMVLEGVEEIEALINALSVVRDMAKVQVSLAEDLGYPITAQGLDDEAGLVLIVQGTEYARLRIIGGRRMMASDVPDTGALFDDEVLQGGPVDGSVAVDLPASLVHALDALDGTVGGFVPVKLEEEPGDVQVGDQVLVHDARALTAISAYAAQAPEYANEHIEVHGGFFMVEDEAEAFVGDVTAISGPYDDHHGPMYCVDGDWWYYRWQLYPVMGEQDA